MLVFLITIIYIENKARKIAVLELSIKTEWLNKIMISLADGLIVTDSNGVITMINQTALSITGWKQQEAIGNHIENVFEINNDKTGIKLLNPAVEAIKRNKIIPLANHTFLKQKNGDKIFIDDSAAPICNENGDVIGSVLIFSDTSDKKRADDVIVKLNHSIEKNEKRFLTTLDGMMEGIQIINFNWQYLYVNDAIVTQGIYTKKELLGHTMMEKFPGIEHTELFKVLERCMRERISDHIETEFNFPDSLSGWFQMNIMPVLEGLFILTIDISERKKAEVQLRESELFSSAVLSSLKSHIAVINADGKIVTVNKAWDDFALANGESMLSRVSKGSNYFDVCKKSILAGDPHAERAMEGIKSVIKNEKNNFELEYPCDSPTEKRWFNLSVIHFGNDRDKVITAHIDITSRKIAEEANKSIETKYRRLFETAKDGILILNADTGKIEDVNPFLIEVLGFSYNYFIGKELWEIGVYKDAKASKSAFHELLEKEYIRYEDLPLKTKDDNPLNVEFVSNVYWVNEKKVIQCNIRDITERKKVEDKIRDSEDKFRSLVENAPDIIMTIDLENKIQFVNHSFPNIPINKVIGTSILNFANPNNIESVRQKLKKIVDTKKPFSYETSGKGPNGTTAWYITNAGPIFKGEKVSGITLIVKDISDRKQAEELLQQQNKELKKTNAELDRFVYSTSHDLRAPLTSVLGLINIMDDSLNPIETEQKKCLGMMKQSITKLDSFIEDIISYSRNSRMEIEKDEINFEELINESQQTLKYMENDSLCKIKVEIDQKGKFISDRRRILIIMNNLISNSIKYYDKSKPNCFINIIVHSDLSKAIITIEDNGIGIADEKQEKVFEMFYRATTLSKGSGLGMYIAAETLIKLNGTITLKSTLNIGSTFTVTIPNLFENT